MKPRIPRVDDLTTHLRCAKHGALVPVCVFSPELIKFRCAENCGYETLLRWDLVEEGQPDVGITEKKRREYYQSLAYSIAVEVDRLLKVSVTSGTGIVVGTVESPSQDLLHAIEKLGRELEQLRKVSV